MNKLIVHEGGQPLNLDDLDFMQNASRLSLEGILTGFIFSGNINLNLIIVRQATSTSWLDGYIAISGEVYKVKAGAISVSQSTDLFFKKVNNDTTPVSLQNGTVVNIYDESYYTISTEGDYNINDIKKLSAIIDSMVTKTSEMHTILSPSPAKENIQITADTYKTGLIVNLKSKITTTAEVELGETGKIGSFNLNYNFTDTALIIKNDGTYEQCVLVCRDGSLYLYSYDGVVVTTLYANMIIEINRII